LSSHASAAVDQIGEQQPRKCAGVAAGADHGDRPRVQERVQRRSDGSRAVSQVLVETLGPGVIGPRPVLVVHNLSLLQLLPPL
jgi:hypothetical protein